MSLLLIRRKRLHFEKTILEDGEEKICLYCPGTSEKLKIVNPRLNEEEMARVQEEVFKVLGWQ